MFNTYEGRLKLLSLEFSKEETIEALINAHKNEQYREFIPAIEKDLHDNYGMPWTEISKIKEERC